MKKVWQKTGNVYYLVESSNHQDTVELGIYRFGVDGRENPFLEKTADSFDFPYKIYGIEEKFITRIDKTYKQTVGNLGIILNGTKGTGKTVTAKMLCNRMNLPVIVVTFAHERLLTFLNDLQEDVIVFIDEYEKYYNRYDNSLLSVLDGILTTGYRKLFLLTTNELDVSRYLLQRPGRIRYIKAFGDLTRETVEEVLDDLLKNPSYRASCLKFISELSIITIDLVKAIIEEVNIHDEDPYEFKAIFNTKSEEGASYSLYKVEEGVEKLFLEYATFHTPPDKLSEGNYFMVNDESYGVIKAILPNNDIITYKDVYDKEDNDLVGQEKIVYRIKSMNILHRMFRPQNLLV